MRHTTSYPPTRAAGCGTGKLVAVLGLLVVLMVLSCVAIFVVPFVVRQQRFNARLEWLDLLLAVGWRLVPLAAVVMVLRIVWRRLGLMESVRADKTIDLYRAIAPALMSGRPVAPAQLGTVIDQPAEALPPAAPRLPDVALLADVLPTMPRGKLAYGVLPGGEQISLTFGAAYHILYGGDTRSGKSNALDSLLVQLHHQHYLHGYNLRVLLGDFKRELLSTWSRSPLVETIETEPKAIAALLVELTRGRDGILDRYKRFEQEGRRRDRVIRNLADYTTVTKQHLPLTFAVVDELNALLTVADKDTKLADALRVVLQLGAGAGVYVASGAQYLSAGVFSRDGSKQFVSRAMFGAPDPVQTRVMFGGGKLDPLAVELIDGRAGRGLIRTAGQARPQPFQALRCDEADILEAVELSSQRKDSDRREGASEVGGSENDELLDSLISAQKMTECDEGRKFTSSTSHAVNTTSATSNFEPEKFYGTKYLLMKGASKSEIIKELWGVTGGRKFSEAAAEFDQIRAALEGGAA
jgi:DNA segregation ATPase FtsK/SpoIIIE-like protein